MQHTIVSAIMVTFFVSACSGTPEGGADDESVANDPSLAYTDGELIQIYDGIEAMGMDSSQVQIDGAELIVEGDMIVDAGDALAAGLDTDTDTDGQDEHDTVDKGYYFNATDIVVGRAREQKQRIAVPSASLKMSFSSSVSNDWKAAFRFAADKWNTNACINFNESSGAALSIETSTGLKPETLADAKVAETTSAGRGQVTGAKAGNRVRINSNLSPSTATMRTTAMHELGHIIGFKHPTEGKHIDDTKSGTSYATVMEAILTTDRSDLTSDDKKTRDMIFKKETVTQRGGVRREVCSTGLIEI